MHRERGEEGRRDREGSRSIERFTAHSPTLSFLQLSERSSALSISFSRVTFSPLIPCSILLFSLLVSRIARASAFLCRPLPADLSFFVCRALSIAHSFLLFVWSTFPLTATISVLSHRRTLSSPPSFSLILPLHLALALSIPCVLSGPTLSPTRRTQYYIPLGPAPPTLPPLPYLDMV